LIKDRLIDAPLLSWPAITDGVQAVSVTLHQFTGHWSIITDSYN